MLPDKKDPKNFYIACIHSLYIVCYEISEEQIVPLK